MSTSHNCVRGERIESIEVFGNLKVNLELLKGKSADKQKDLRLGKVLSVLYSSNSHKELLSISENRKAGVVY